MYKKKQKVTSGEYRMDEACELGDHPQGVYPAHTRVELRTLKVEFQKSAWYWISVILNESMYIEQQADVSELLPCAHSCTVENIENKNSQKSTEE